MVNDESKTGYARTDRAMLCARCTSGRVIESAQGHTMVYCDSRVQTAAVVPFIVVRCSRFDEVQPARLWSKATEVRVVDGVLQILREEPGCYGWFVYATGEPVNESGSMTRAQRLG